VGDAYRRVAEVQGVPSTLSLGEYAQAERSLKKAEGALDFVLSRRPGNRAALISSARISADRMILAESERRGSDALAHSRNAATRLHDLLQRGAATEPEVDNVSAIYGNLALASVNMRLYDDGIRYGQRAVEVARLFPSTRARVASGLSVVANARRLQGDLEGALAAIQEARAIAESAADPSAVTRMFDTYPIALREGFILGEDQGVSLDRPDEAIAAFQQAFDMTEAIARRDARDSTSRSRVGTSGRALGNVLRWRDPERAVAVYDVAIGRLGEIQNNLRARRDLAAVLTESSYALGRLGRGAEAARRIDSALAILKDVKDLPADRITLESEACAVFRALADHEADEGHLAQAAAGYDALLQKVMAAKPDPASDLREAKRLARLYEGAARVYRLGGAAAKADAIDARRLDVWREWDRKLPNNPFVLRQLAIDRR